MNPSPADALVLFGATGDLAGKKIYRGYRAEADVAPDSQVETFAAMQIHLDSWRWQGVPFFIRAGKRLPVTATEVVVALRRPPQQIFPATIPSQSNYLRFRLGPRQVAIAIGAMVKRHGTENVGDAVELDACDTQGDAMEAYERLIGDALKGDAALFGRQDGIEAAWRIVDPILNNLTSLREYEPGTWGPSEAVAMMDQLGGWRDTQVG